MNGRKPGGDRRLVVGCFREPDGSELVFGFTFAFQCSFVPFFESPEQLATDIALGARYHRANPSGHLIESSQHFHLPDSDRSVLCSENEFESWAGAPLEFLPELEEGSDFLELEWWRRQWRLESEAYSITPFLVRRERRLNAALPD